MVVGLSVVPFFFYPFFSFSTQFSRLRSTFGLTSLDKINRDWKFKIHLRCFRFTVFWRVILSARYAIKMFLLEKWDHCKKICLKKGISLKEKKKMKSVSLIFWKQILSSLSFFIRRKCVYCRKSLIFCFQNVFAVSCLFLQRQRKYSKVFDFLSRKLKKMLLFISKNKHWNKVSKYSYPLLTK